MGLSLRRAEYDRASVNSLRLVIESVVKSNWKKRGDVDLFSDDDLLVLLERSNEEQKKDFVSNQLFEETKAVVKATTP